MLISNLMDEGTGFDSSDDLDDPGISPNPNHNASSSGGSNLLVPAPCTLYLTSYGHHFGPFPAPPVIGGLAPRLIQYDIRALPNPPKNVRAKQTGLHKAHRGKNYI
ncbi:hypothetical protein C8R47DRAFT_720221 [Mycena vitilis]|nr:hypothetical protein C8R47DRAFT_720221 [Mycena vitilis]